MNKIVFCVLAMFSLVKLQAQQKEGKVIYQRTVQMQIRIADNAGPEREMPRTRTDKFEMDFANGQMIIRQMDDEMPEENPGGGGMMIPWMLYLLLVTGCLALGARLLEGVVRSRGWATRGLWVALKTSPMR